MRRRIFKLAFFVIYFLAGGVISYFIPDQIKFVLGFTFALLSGWAWKMMSKEVHHG